MLVLIALTSPLVLIESESIPFSTRTTKSEISFDLFFLKELVTKIKNKEEILNNVRFSLKSNLEKFIF